MTPDPSWADLAAGLPVHASEVMASHRGTGDTGLPAPDPDLGQDDQSKYSC